MNPGEAGRLERVAADDPLTPLLDEAHALIDNAVLTLAHPAGDRADVAETLEQLRDVLNRIEQDFGP